MKISAHCDALGNPIIIGNKYGWSRSDSGYTHVAIGYADKLTEKAVTIRVESARECLYDDDPKTMNIDGAYPSMKSKVSIKGINLFPVQ